MDVLSHNLAILLLPMEVIAGYMGNNDPVVDGNSSVSEMSIVRMGYDNGDTFCIHRMDCFVNLVCISTFYMA